MRQTVYIETTVVSYLTARPSSDPQKAEWQAATKDWWEVHRPHCDLYTSTLTIDEAEEGNPEAARRRVRELRGMNILEETDDINSLSDALMKAKALPENSEDDATHIATAAVHGIDFLLTWNQKHIANPRTNSLIRAICTQQGYRCPEIRKPNEF